MIRSFGKFVVLFVAITGALSGCGGGGGSVAGGTGGIGGTGVRVAGVGEGTTTGFGSIIIDDIREFTIDAQTALFRDDSAITEAQLEQSGAGFVTRVEIGEDVTGDFSAGTAVSVRLENYLRGPVTNVSPLTVLGQALVVTGDTVLVDLAGAGALIVGDEVEISGYPNAANVVQATRIQRQAGGIPVWKLRGRAGNVTAGDFTIGSQLVQLNGVVPRDCGSGLANGDLVEVEASRDPGFNPGDPLVTVTDVACTLSGLGVPADAVGTQLAAGVEGLVTAISAANDFVVGGQRVQTTPGTLFEGGSAQDIVAGAKLEAEGVLDTATGILAAQKLRFRETRVRVEAPVNVPGSGVDDSFTIMDVITVNTTALTEDNDGLVDGSGPAGNRQLEVRGFVDSSGAVFATEVRDRGAADAASVRLRGPASDTCDPTAGDNALAVLDVIIDTSDPGTLFGNPDGPLPDSSALCSQISIGTAVQAENGTFSSTPARIEQAERIEIED